MMKEDLQAKIKELEGKLKILESRYSELGFRVAHLEPLVARLEQEIFPRCKECGQELFPKATRSPLARVDFGAVVKEKQ